MKRKIFALLILLGILLAGPTLSNDLTTPAVGRWPFHFGGGLLTHVPEQGTILVGSKGGGIAVYDPDLNPITRLDTGVGEIKRFAVTSELVYVGARDAVVLYDYPFPEALFPLSTYRPDTKIQSVYFLGDNAYLLLDDGRIQVVSFSDPLRPVLQTDYLGLVGEGEVTGFTVFNASTISSAYGAVAYLIVAYSDTAESYGPDSRQAMVLDFADLGSPHLTDQLFYAEREWRIRGTLAYGNWNTVDISDPINPVRTNYSGPSSSGGQTRLNGVYNYVSNISVDTIGESPYIRIYDLSIPESPQRVAWITEFAFSDMIFVGETGYSVSLNTGAIQKWNLADPSQPELIAERVENRESEAYKLYVSGDRAYLVEKRDRYWVPMSTSGFRVFDITHRDQPESIAWFDLSTLGIRDVAVEGNNALLLDEEGLSIVELSDPTTPRVLGRWTSGGSFPRNSVVRVVGRDRAYLSDLSHLYILDVSDMTRPNLIGVYGFSESIADSDPWLARFARESLVIQDVVVSGSRAVLAVAFDNGTVPATIGFQTLDLSDPASPRRVANFDDYPPPWIGSPGRTSHAFEVQDDTLFVAFRNKAYLFDISDPSNPTPTKVWEGGGWQSRLNIDDIDVQGKYAYLAGTDGIYLVNFASSEVVREVDSIEGSGGIMDLALDDDYLYVIDEQAGLVIYDRPLTPVERLYNSWRERFLFTSDSAEAESLTRLDSGFIHEFTAFHALPRPTAATTPVHQFLNSASGTYFYTISEEEKNYLENSLPAFSYVGVAYHAFDHEAEGSVPLYRFYDPAGGYHFYTDSEEEKALINTRHPGFLYDGVAFYVMP